MVVGRRGDDLYNSHANLLKTAEKERQDISYLGAVSYYVSDSSQAQREKEPNLYLL